MRRLASYTLKGTGAPACGRVKHTQRGCAPLEIPPRFQGCFAPRREALFLRIKSAQKAASLRLERFIYVVFGDATARIGFVFR